MHTFVQPVLEMLDVRGQRQFGNAGIGKSQFARPEFDTVRQVIKWAGGCRHYTVSMNEISRRLYALAEVRELDHRAIVSGIPGYQLMQRAATACWQEMARRWPLARKVHVICGAGNNGGDGFEIARLAFKAGCTVKLWALDPTASSGDAEIARKAWLAQGGVATLMAEMDLSDAEVVVDALFGIGLSRLMEGAALQAIQSMQRAKQNGVKVLSVDVPSGLDAESGKIWGDAVAADVTVTFIGDKLGLHTGAGKDHAGEVICHQLDIPAALFEGVPSQALLMSADDLARGLAPRKLNSHKGHHGHVLLIGGNRGMAGAIQLAGRAALHAGAGLVSVATRAEHKVALTAAQPELMCHAVESQTQLLPLLQQADVIAIGPGLGQDAWARELLARVLQSQLPLVLDADALNLLAEEPMRSERWVLTPHPGEAARLLDLTTSEIQNDRGAAARQIQRQYGGVVVLKGAGTLVQGAQSHLCPYGNPGMAVGGMGDVLTGIIAAFIAQGLAAEQAAAAAVLAHALAGDQAAKTGQRGLLPSDVIAVLRGIVNP